MRGKLQACNISVGSWRHLVQHVCVISGTLMRTWKQATCIFAQYGAANIASTKADMPRKSSFSCQQDVDMLHMSVDIAMMFPPELRRGNAPQQLDNMLLSMHQYSIWHVVLLGSIYAVIHNHTSVRAQ